ncbi:MAG: hypothetical protein COW16_11690 [Sphingomonadales bacterium CG12_big_fil_rev_8_21_14_0_65_65_10]|uniref:Uncharacterized protein n=1 Tax=Blastomonas marina TaxID=1867408 RepID=A0ABQ1FCW0_9SPHN|nr:hypothetical protein [Blastomonas marina]PIW54356.1 MAG: hypothetical protein COW16_11690 [Sphingomonadales bacterium CG12_big_fil_rev_8_21_14_0_65_65_10]GGA05780.1 hypothetical protein GCM10010923_14520 [Blastomonas marina]
MTSILITAVIAAAASFALYMLVRDTGYLVAKHGEWQGKLARIDRDSLRDPAAFTLRAPCDAKRGVPARPSSPRPLRAAA